MSTSTATTASSGAPTVQPGGADFHLRFAGEEQRALGRAWLWLGLAALIGSGLFSVLLVAARTPGINQWLPAADFFRVALVVHVDLSVLVWFAAMAGMLWSLNGSARGASASWVALGLCSAGTLMMALAAFASPGTAIMANYIPVLTNPLFQAGLVAFGVGAAVKVLRNLWAAQAVGTTPDGAAALRFGLNASVVSSAVALLALLGSLALVPTQLDGKAYFEILFWGAGHALQFTWTLMMLVAWLWLAQAVAQGPGSARGWSCSCSHWRWPACSSRPMPTWPMTWPASNTARCTPGPCASVAGWPSSRWRWPCCWPCCRGAS